MIADTRMIHVVFEFAPTPSRRGPGEEKLHWIHNKLAKSDVNVQFNVMQLISRTSEYALRAVIWLVQEPARSQTTRQIATGTRTPPDYVSKVLQLPVSYTHLT